MNEVIAQVLGALWVQVYIGYINKAQVDKLVYVYCISRYLVLQK